MYICPQNKPLRRVAFDPRYQRYHYRPRDLRGFARMMERYGRFSGGILTRRYGFFRALSLEPVALLLGLSTLAGAALFSVPATLTLVAMATLALYLSLAVRCGGPGAGIQSLWLLAVLLYCWNLGYVRGILTPPATLQGPGGRSTST